MSLFFKDSVNNKVISWERLIQDINNTSTYNPYCLSEDYYTIFKTIILSIILGKEIILLDSDNSEQELNNLVGTTDFESHKIEINKSNEYKIENKDHLIETIQDNMSSDWRVTLFTSGTTGKPKKVSHSFQSITRFVKITDKNKDSIWGFAYNPTHMAGLQVLFQALMNGNSIIRLFGLSTKRIFAEIGDNEITHISATPTFYRLLLPSKDAFSTVLRITTGGEKFSENTIEQLRSVFPNAKITNVYASTEAGTLFASDDDIFSIQTEYKQLVLIKDNELLIHKSLMGQTSFFAGDWYKTGDQVEVITKDPLTFKFANRKNEMINIGGYKVNPHEVEDAILGIDKVKNVHVYAKQNSVLGEILICDIVSSEKDLEESFIRNCLKDKLKDYKIPRVIKFVNELTTTRSGKIKRK